MLVFPHPFRVPPPAKVATATPALVARQGPMLIPQSPDRPSARQCARRQPEVRADRVVGWVEERIGGPTFSGLAALCSRPIRLAIGLEATYVQGVVSACAVEVPAPG